MSLFSADNVGSDRRCLALNADASICCTAEILANRSLREGGVGRGRDASWTSSALRGSPARLEHLAGAAPGAADAGGDERDGGDTTRFSAWKERTRRDIDLDANRRAPRVQSVVDHRLPDGRAAGRAAAVTSCFSQRDAVATASFDRLLRRSRERESRRAAGRRVHEGLPRAGLKSLLSRRASACAVHAAACVARRAPHRAGLLPIVCSCGGTLGVSIQRAILQC